METEEAEATQFLESLLGKTLHVTVPDGTTLSDHLVVCPSLLMSI